MFSWNRQQNAHIEHVANILNEKNAQAPSGRPRGGIPIHLGRCPSSGAELRTRRAAEFHFPFPGKRKPAVGGARRAGPGAGGARRAP